MSKYLKEAIKIVKENDPFLPRNRRQSKADWDAEVAQGEAESGASGMGMPPNDFHTGGSGAHTELKKALRGAVENEIDQDDFDQWLDSEMGEQSQAAFDQLAAAVGEEEAQTVLNSILDDLHARDEADAQYAYDMGDDIDDGLSDDEK